MINKIKNKLSSDTHFTEILKGSSIAFILRILGIGAVYIFTLLVTRNLGAESWGVFALSLVILQVASVIGRLGMDTTLLRFTAEYFAKEDLYTLKDIYKKALTFVLPFSIFISVLVYFLSPILAEKVFNKPYLTQYFQIISLIIVPFVLLWIHTESIRGLKKIKEYMLLQQSGIFIVAIILFMGGLTFWKTELLPVISYSTAVVLLSIVSVYLWKKYLKYLLKNIKGESNSNTKFNYKSLLSVSVPMLFSSSLALIMGWTDIIMLGIFRTTEEVGIYNVALRVSMITSITLMAINTIAAPKFAEFWGKGDIKGVAKVAQQSTKLIFWTSFPILLMFLIFPKQILGIFGEEFKAGTIALMILTIGQFVNAAAGSVGYILQMTGYQKFHQNVVLIGAILNIILNYLLIPIYGIIGAAIASAISVIFWNVVFFSKAKKIMREK